jgi:hypothetical protein
MSAFEFFFSFYGLLLGLSVAELVGGFARVLHERERVRFGWLTPLLAVFVAVDVATFWNQAWLIFRFAPFNFALLVVGLTIAATFYVAASVTFPRVTAEGVTTRIDLDDHFWAHRRLIFTCVLAANLIVAGLFFALTGLSGEIAMVQLGLIFWIGLAIFIGGTATAAFAPRKAAMTALVVLVAYHLFSAVRSALVVVEAGGWSLFGAAGGG